MLDVTANTILENYAGYNEDNRLSNPYGILEEEHTRRIIKKYLGPSRQIIYDIGGGTGPYSFWLSKMGYEVHLSDIVPKHVKIAIERDPQKSLGSIQIEDARVLTYHADSADLIILNGPLYHLPSNNDRKKVLDECYRVLKNDGCVLAIGITRLSGLMYALSSGEIFNNNYFTMVKKEIETGYRDNRLKINKTFLEAYFHNSAELTQEVKNSGFNVIETKGILGQAWNTPDLQNAILNAEKKERLLEVAEMMENYPDFSPKIICIGKKSS